MRETSLDEFVGGGDAAPDADAAKKSDRDAGDANGDPEPDTGDGTDADARHDTVEADDAAAPDADSAPEPGVPTFGWRPDGAGCARCGEAAARRWRDDGELVCPSCKTW